MATVWTQRKLTTEEIINLLKKHWNYLSCNVFGNSLSPCTFNPEIRIDMKKAATYLIKKENLAELMPHEVELAIIQIFKDFEKRNPDIRLDTYTSHYVGTKLIDFKVELTVHVIPRHVPSVGQTD